ncbi:NRDE family protein [Salinicoccus cyprini]|uniref:NRDE family protein n=1 Tax=Salinicoccus cyprini TaxID=2493691 RepID=A0A558AUA6_9STAP|nr:NRDE family protein [Salinicoccus cyprini]TVT27839.1 NRDE family protein [Salinicoccus cyprini]
MCLIIFQKNTHPHYKLVVAANRDEFYGRPTAPAQFWKQHPEMLAGQDLSKGGTWLGLTKQGRFAAVTNIRKPGFENADKKSRGALVSDYLTGDATPEAYLDALDREKDDYSGFNLLVGNQNELFYLHNDGGTVDNVTDGPHGLSNHHLDTPWPKVVKGRERLDDYMKTTEEIDIDVIFQLLADSEQTTGALPETGLPETLERQLSSAFISIPEYGTRSSTVVLIDHDDNATFVERTFTEDGQTGENRYTFKIES